MYDLICRKLLIWSHLLKKSSTENFLFYAVKGNRYMTLKSSASSFFYYGKFYKEKLKQQIPKLSLKD